MSASIMLSGTTRSTEPVMRRNPFTAEMQSMHTYSMTAEQRAAVTAVLARHGVRGAGGEFTVTLPGGVTLNGQRDEDHIHFFDSAAHTDAALALIFEVAVAGDLAIGGDWFQAVTTPAAQERMTPGEADEYQQYPVVTRPSDLRELLRQRPDED